MTQASAALADAEKTWRWIRAEAEAWRLGADGDLRDQLCEFWDHAAGATDSEKNRAAMIAVDLRAFASGMKDDTDDDLP